jgi:hypothetical protein
MPPDTESPTFRYAERRIEFLRARAIAAVERLDFRRAAELELEAFEAERRLARQKAGMN